MSELFFKLWDSLCEQLIGMVEETITTLKIFIAAEKIDIAS